MMSHVKSLILVFAFLSLCLKLNALNVDSLLQKRENAYQRYMDYKENIGERTWIRLVNLSDYANQVIELDNGLIENHFGQETNQIAELAEKNESLKLEISLLHREAEIQKMLLEERKYLLDSSLIIIGGISLLFLVLLIYSIDRTVRYKNTKIELERTWAGQMEPHGKHYSDKNFAQVNQEIKSLTTENSKLKDQVLELMNKIREKEKVLDEELKSRKQLKEEIRNLIAQIKER